MHYNRKTTVYRLPDAVQQRYNDKSNSLGIDICPYKTPKTE